VTVTIDRTSEETDEDQQSPAPIPQGYVDVDTVKAYLREIGRVPLLTAEQEVEIAKRIEAGLYATELLRAHDDAEHPMAADMLRDLRFVARDGERAKSHLWRPTSFWSSASRNATAAAACRSWI